MNDVVKVSCKRHNAVGPTSGPIDRIRIDRQIDRIILPGELTAYTDPAEKILSFTKINKHNLWKYKNKYIHTQGFHYFCFFCCCLFVLFFWQPEAQNSPIWSKQIFSLMEVMMSTEGLGKYSLMHSSVHQRIHWTVNTSDSGKAMLATFKTCRREKN